MARISKLLKKDIDSNIGNTSFKIQIKSYLEGDKIREKRPTTEIMNEIDNYFFFTILYIIRCILVGMVDSFIVCSVTLFATAI